MNLEGGATVDKGASHTRSHNIEQDIQLNNKAKNMGWFGIKKQ